MARFLRRIFVGGALAVLSFVVLSNLWIWWAAWGRMEGEVPAGSVIVLLGTNEFFPDGVTPNATYRQRITTALAAAGTGRASLVIASGTEEQAEVMAAALKRGACRTPIELDPYGWRTLDSVLRAKAQHPGRPLVFVSQGWHCARALWWADRLGVSASAVPAAYGDGLDAHRSAARDLLAKPKAVMDWVVGLGPSSPAPVDAGNRRAP